MYHSLVDRFAEETRWNPLYDPSPELLLCAQQVDTTLLDILDNVEQVASDPPSPGRTAAMIWLPQHIVRASIEHKIDNPAEHSFVHAATAAALGFYTDQNVRHIQELRDYLCTEAPQALFDRVVQESDPKTVRALHPSHCERTARDIAQYNDILLIPLANGGIAAGLDIALRARSHGCETAVYPVRLSMYKSADTAPQLHPHEKDELTALSKEKTLVVFDEDCETGSTLIRAAAFFSKLPTTRIVYAVNVYQQRPGFVIQSDHNTLI